MRVSIAGPVVALSLALAPALAHADVVDSCPPWQQGYDGHGMTCSTNWPVLGGGAGCCGVGAALIASLALLALRRPPEGRTRGD